METLCKTPGCEKQVYKEGLCIDCKTSQMKQKKGKLPAQSSQPVIIEIPNVMSKTVEEVGKEYLMKSPDVTQEEIDEYIQLFKSFDKDSDKTLNSFEVTQMFEKLGMTKTYTEIRELIKKINTSNTGKINFCEFLNCVHPSSGLLDMAPLKSNKNIQGQKCAEKAAMFEQFAQKASKSNQMVASPVDKQELQRRREEEEKRLAEEQENQLAEEQKRKNEFKKKNEALFGGFKKQQSSENQ